MSKVRSIDTIWDQQEDLVFDKSAVPTQVMHLGKIFNVQMNSIFQLAKYIGTGDVCVNFKTDVAFFHFEQGKLADNGKNPAFKYCSGINCFLVNWQNQENSELKYVSLFTTSGNSSKGIAVEKADNLDDFNVKEAIIHLWDGTNKIVTDSDELKEICMMMSYYNLEKELIWG